MPRAIPHEHWHHTNKSVCIHHETIPISTGYTYSFHSGLMWIVYIGMSQNYVLNFPSLSSLS